MRVFIQTHLFMSKIVHFVESVRRLLQCVWHLIVYNWYCLLHAWTGQRRDLYPHTLHFMLLPLEREFSKIYQFVIRFLRVEFSSCEPQTWVIKPELFQCSIARLHVCRILLEFDLKRTRKFPQIVKIVKAAKMDFLIFYDYVNEYEVSYSSQSSIFDIMSSCG